MVAVPQGPGLGVRLDQAALQRAHDHYLQNGPLDYYDDPDGDGRRRRLPIA